MSEKVEEGVFIDEPEQYLALHVLKQARRDNEYSSRGMLEFWCDAAGLTPAVFFDRVAREEEA